MTWLDTITREVIVTLDGVERVVTIDGFGEATDGETFVTGRDVDGLLDYELWGDGLAEVSAGDVVRKGTWRPDSRST